MNRLPITDVRFVATGKRDRTAGLFAFVSVTLADCFVLDGITLRRTEDRRWSLSFPARTDQRGVRHPYLRPANDATRRAFEQQVFEALGLGER